MSNETVSCPEAFSLGMYIFVQKGSYYLATANRTWPPVPNSPGCTGWSCAEFICCYIHSFSAVLFANRYAQRCIHTCDGPLPASSSTCNRTLTTQQSLHIFVLSRQWEKVTVHCTSWTHELWIGEAKSVNPSSALLTGRSGHHTVVHNPQELMHQNMIYTNKKEFVRTMVL